MKHSTSPNGQGTPQRPRSLRGRLRIKSFRVELTLIIFFLMLAASGFIVLVYALLHFIFPSLKEFDSVGPVRLRH